MLSGPRADSLFDKEKPIWVSVFLKMRALLRLHMRGHVVICIHVRTGRVLFVTVIASRRKSQERSSYLNDLSSMLVLDTKQSLGGNPKASLLVHSSGRPEVCTTFADMKVVSWALRSRFARASNMTADHSQHTTVQNVAMLLGESLSAIFCSPRRRQPTVCRDEQLISKTFSAAEYCF